MDQFEIALINPIRLVRIEQIDERYYYVPFDYGLSYDLIPNFQEKTCYFQKFTTLDETKIQIISDFDSISVNIYDLNTGYIAFADLQVTEVASAIVGQTFKLYEVTLDFSILNEGEYYIELTYINELLQPVLYQSEPIMIRDVHENTILLEYTNSENNFSVAFDTGVNFSLRVEAAILDFTPETDINTYTDQTRNATLLSATPYRSFTAYFGAAKGLPPWMADKLNRILSCDSVRYDGEYYQRVEGSKWEAKRADDYPFTGWTIEITPVENKNLQQLIIGDEPLDGEFTPMQKVLKYIDNAEDITISNVFKKYTLLEKICILRTGGVFTLNVGITDGGAEIGTFEVDDLIETLNINYLFSDTETVYLTGLDGTNNDIVILYKQLDEKPVSLTPGPASSLGKGSVLIYEEVSAGDLEVDFNMASGLGNPDTDWDGWAICDGRNGTQDRGGVFPIGYKLGGDFEELGDTGGADSFSIASTDNLPQFRVKLFAPTVNSTGGDIPTPDSQVARANGGSHSYELHRATAEATLGRSSPIGKTVPDAITHIPKYIVSLWVKKIL